MIELPPIAIQLHIAQLLNAIQYLLVNKDSLVTAIEDSHSILMIFQSK